MNSTLAVECTVSRAAATTPAQVSSRYTSVPSSKAYTTVTPATSVGPNQPLTNPPTRMTGASNAGKATIKHLPKADQSNGVVSAGRFWRRAMTLTWAGVVAAARETVHSTASVLFIVGSAALFAWVLTIDQVPMKASELLLGMSKNPYVLLLLVNVLLLVVGMVMESIAAILILAPILTPALMAAGVDPVQLGVVVVLNLMIGLLTPPVGMSLYMVSSIARLPLQRVVAGAMPWLIPLVLALAVVTFVPVVSTWLPNLIMK